MLDFLHVGLALFPKLPTPKFMIIRQVAKVSDSLERRVLQSWHISWASNLTFQLSLRVPSSDINFGSIVFTLHSYKSRYTQTLYSHHCDLCRTTLKENPRLLSAAEDCKLREACRYTNKKIKTFNSRIKSTQEEVNIEKIF